MNKRKVITSCKTINKKIKTMNELPIIDSQWISGSQTRNYMLKDPLLDWLNLYGENKGYKKEIKLFDFSNYIKKKGDEFETYIISIIKNKYEDKFVEVDNPNFHVPSNNNLTDEEKNKIYHEQINQTISLMKKGVEIIYQGLIYNPKTKIFGYPDLIVRSDFLNTLVPNTISTKNSKQGCIFSNDYHYRIVDIKFTSLKLKVNNKNLLNQNKILPYKSQVFIYNEALSYIQKYKPNKAYLLGRNVVCKSNIYKSLDKLAQIDFVNEEIKEDTYSALEWIRRLRNEGNKWDLNLINEKLVTNELYPNMCNDYDSEWRNVKTKLAEDINEITLLWQCGVNNREIAHLNKKYTWDSCTSKTLGINGPKIGPMLDNILYINRTDFSYVVDQKKIKLYKDKLNYDNCLYVDFETSSNILSVEGDSKEMIFMIGFIENNEYISFIADKLNEESEEKIVKEFISYIQKRNEKVVLYHYSFAEPTNFNKAIEKYKLSNENIIWIDLLPIVKETGFVTHGMMNYSLKTLISSLVKNNLIPQIEGSTGASEKNNNITNGSDAMIAAFQAYELSNSLQFKVEETDIMKCIQNYNRSDCIYLKYLRDILRRI